MLDDDAVVAAAAPVLVMIVFGVLFGVVLFVRKNNDPICKLVGSRSGGFFES